MTIVVVLSTGIVAALTLTLLATWIARWRGWRRESPWKRYWDKAIAADTAGDTEWCVRCFHRAHEARPSKRLTDHVPDTPPPIWLWLLAMGTTLGVIVSLVTVT